MSAKKNISDQRQVFHDLLKSIPENESISLIGAHISDHRDLAALAEVYRSPRYETFRYLFTRNSEVVGITAVSSRRVNSSRILIGDDDKSYCDNLIKKAAGVHADRVFFLHNHPSGDPTPSFSDLHSTQNLIDNLLQNSPLGFGGHVIINSTQYSVINADGSYDILPIEFKSYNLNQMRQSNSFFGTSIYESDDLAELAKTLQNSANSFLAIGLNTKSQCNCLYDIGYDIFEKPTKELLQTIRLWSEASGVHKYALVNFSSQRLKRYRKERLIESLAGSGMILDIITEEGISLRNSLRFSYSGNYPYLNKKAYEVHDYQTDYNSESQLEFNFDEKPDDNENEREKNKRQNQGNPAIPRHSDRDGASGNREYSSLTESTGQRDRTSVDARFGELFMWASRSRPGITTQSTNDEPENVLPREIGSDNKRSVRSTSESPEKEPSADAITRGPAQNLQGDLRDLNNSSAKHQYQIIETVHSQKGHDLFVVQLPKRVDKTEFSELLRQVKSLKGYYSTFNRDGAVPGFQFKTRDKAEEFITLLLQKEVLSQDKPDETIDDLIKDKIEQAELDIGNEPVIKKAELPAYTVTTAKLHFDENGISPEITNIEEFREENIGSQAERILQDIPNSAPLINPLNETIFKLAEAFELWRQKRNSSPFPAGENIRKSTVEVWLEQNAPSWRLHTDKIFTAWQKRAREQKNLQGFEPIFNREEFLLTYPGHERDLSFVSSDSQENSPSQQDIERIAKIFENWRKFHNSSTFRSEKDIDSTVMAFWLEVNIPAWKQYPEEVYSHWKTLLEKRHQFEIAEIELAKTIFSEIKSLIKIQENIIDLGQFNKALNQKLDDSSSKPDRSLNLNAKGRVSAYAHGFVDEDFDYTRYGWSEPQYQKLEEIAFKPFKKGWVTTNNISLRQYPNGFYAASYNVMFDHGGSGSIPILFNSVLYRSKEQAICKTADEMIELFSSSASKEARHYLKEAQRVKAEHGNYIGELFESVEKKKDQEITSEKQNEQEELTALTTVSLERNTNNFVIADPNNLFPSGDLTKIKANILAIQTLKQIETQERSATQKEKETLSHYVGWGGLKNLFSSYEVPDNWKAYSAELKGLLNDEEWSSAAQSVLNAHYTAPEIIQAMWQAALHLGFKGGHVLEPAAGIGHFIGLIPEELKSKSYFHSVECDSISARILAQLYPDANNQQSYFEYASLKNNSMDLIISNVPFLENPHRDPKYDKMHVHDYFFNRAMDLLKPGAVMMAISTSGSLDSYRSRKSRQLLSKKADMVGAFRLPSDAFKKNAGAEVTTDIIILRKKDLNRFQGHDFIRIKEIAGSEQVCGTLTNEEGEEENIYKSIEVNEYYINHPDMMLGQMHLGKGRFADSLEQSLIPTHEDLGLALKEAIVKLPANLMNSVTIDFEEKALIADEETKSYSFLIDESGHVVQKIEGFLERIDGFESPVMKKRAADFIELRELSIAAVNAQVNPNLSDSEVESHRLKLCKKFSAFEKRHGSPWNGNIQRQFRTDPEFALILSLQESTAVIEDGKIKNIQKATGLLKGRTAWPLRLPENAESVKDAFYISLAYKGKIDLAYIAGLCGESEADSKKTIINDGLAFFDPESGLLTDRAQYLSGNVRTKLEIAQAFLSENPEYEINIDALKEVQPQAIGIDSINFRLGSQWIDEEVLNKWSKNRLSGNLRFRYSDSEHKWYISGSCIDDPQLSSNRVSTKRLIEVTLSLRNIEVFDVIMDDGKERRVLNERETAYALEKQTVLKENFVDFVKNTPETYKKVEEDYNLVFNSFAPKKYAVPPIKYFPGATQVIEGRDYQKSAIVRAVNEPVLLAHAVGAGKTFEMITAVMEKKRLGIARKSMIVVQNATVAQFATFTKTLYPNARVLAPLSKTEYAAKKRQLFLSRIASNDWDAVIIPQSFFNLIKDDPEFVKEYYEERIEEYKAAKAESDDKITVRNMEKAIERFQAIADSYIHEKGDETLNFSQLGVDCLVLDEAHEYKKVGIATAMGAVKGLDTGVSQRAQRAYMKIRYIRQKSNGQNIILATGTPITNTLAELYTMIRLTNEKTLEAYGIYEFDQFAAVFTEAVTAPELTATNKLKMVTRLSKFINQPELIRMFRSSADVITGSQLSQQKGVEKPEIIGGRPQAVVIPRGPWLGQYIAALQKELEEFENMSGKQRKENCHIPLTVMSRARKAAIDPRLLGQVIGMTSPPDDPDSKTNTVIKNILKIASETDDLNGTQMVFSDLFQSPGGHFNLFEDMKAKLIEAGMPEEQVVIIHDYSTDVKRERLFADMNAGRVRVLLGTTDRMGVGVNAQERMKAMHHMDAPWMPMQMEQRIGRIARHGNIYAHNGGVYVQTYGVEKTMDAAIFQKILTKQKFIEAILEGKVNERVIEDESSDMALSAQEFTALFSGNPDVMRKFELESEIKTLRIQKDSWRQQMRTSRNQLEALSEKIKGLEELLPLASEKLKDLQALVKTFESGRQLEINGQLIADDKVKETLNSFAKTHLNKTALMASRSNKSEFILDIPDSLKINGRRVFLKAEVAMNLSGQAVSFQIHYDCENSYPLNIAGQVASGFGVLSSFKQALTYKPQEFYTELESKLKNARPNKLSTEDFLNKPFRREQELMAKESELASLVLDSDTNKQTAEEEMQSTLSPFKTWIQEQNIAQLAQATEMDGEQEEMLLAFKELDRDEIPLNILWKLADIVKEENIVFLNEEIECQQVDTGLLQAYKRATDAYESLKGEVTLKAHESSQVNTESVANEILQEVQLLSQAMHGLCNGESKTWDHCKAKWLDEAFVPALDGQFTDAIKPDYVKNLIRKYNIKLASAQAELSSATAVKIKM